MARRHTFVRNYRDKRVCMLIQKKELSNQKVCQKGKINKSKIYNVNSKQAVKKQIDLSLKLTICMISTILRNSFRLSLRTESVDLRQRMLSSFELQTIQGNNLKITQLNQKVKGIKYSPIRSTYKSFVKKSLKHLNKLPFSCRFFRRNPNSLGFLLLFYQNSKKC